MALVGVGVTTGQLLAQGLNGDGVVGLLLFAGLLAALVRGLWVRFEPPAGLVLAPDEHPALSARVEEIRTRLGAPPMDEIRLDGSLNAAVSLTPRGLRPPLRTLVLGLPLLALETPEEAAATIAHELAHVYGGDDRAQVRAARWQVIWTRLAAGLGAGGLFSRWLFAPFFAWYGPWLTRRLRPLGRHRELAADALAARVVGVPPSVEGLLRDAASTVRARYEVLPALEREVAQGQDDASSPLERFVELLARPWPDAQARLWLRALLLMPTIREDTHPSLADRLAALGVPPPAAPPPPARPSAADVLLGPGAASVRAAVQARWVAERADRWGEAARAERHARSRLDELERVAERAALPPDEEVELALLTAPRRPAAVALPRLRRAAELAPKRADVQVALGLALLDDGQEEGARLLGRWLPRHPERMEEGLWRLLLDRLQRDREDEAAELATRLARWPHEWAQVERERSGLSLGDELVPHDLGPETLRPLVIELSARPEVRRAWVVLKVVKALPEVPCRFLVVETTLDGQRLRAVPQQRALAEVLRASGRLPPDTTVLVAESGLREGMLPMVGLAERVRGALIYERPDAE